MIIQPYKIFIILTFDYKIIYCNYHKYHSHLQKNNIGTYSVLKFIK